MTDHIATPDGFRILKYFDVTVNLLIGEARLQNSNPEFFSKRYCRPALEAITEKVHLAVRDEFLDGDVITAVSGPHLSTAEAFTWRDPSVPELRMTYQQAIFRPISQEAALEKSTT